MAPSRFLTTSENTRLIGAAVNVATWAPAALIVTGLSGGCGPDLEPGDVVVGDPVAGPGAELDAVGGDPALRRRAVRALEAARLRYRTGRLLTVDEIVTSPAAKAACWRTQGALAVDMESAHVVDWARRAGLPALTVDTCVEDDYEGKIRAYLAKKPRLTQVAGDVAPSKIKTEDRKAREAAEQ